MLNKTILIGNVGKDPEIKEIGQNKIAKFSLATSKTWKNKQGEKQNKTQWHNIVIWNKLAEVVEKYVKKGSKLYLEGEIQYNEYEKDGKKTYFIQINCNNMVMLGSNDNKVEVKKLPKKEEKEEQFEDVDDLPF